MMTDQRIGEYDSFFCDDCRTYVFDEAKGDPEHGVAPETRIDALPSSWKCPRCGARKNRLREATMVDDFVSDSKDMEKIGNRDEFVSERS